MKFQTLLVSTRLNPCSTSHRLSFQKIYRKSHVPFPSWRKLHFVNYNNIKHTSDSLQHSMVMWISKFHDNDLNELTAKFQVPSLKNVSMVKIRTLSKMRRKNCDALSHPILCPKNLVISSSTPYYSENESPGFYQKFSEIYVSLMLPNCCTNVTKLRHCTNFCKK